MLLNPIESNISKQTIFQSCNIGVVASKLFNLQSINLDVIIDRFHLILASEHFSIIIALFRKIEDIISFTRLIDNISIEVITQVANEIISPLNDKQIVKEQDKDFQFYFHRILEYICAHEMETLIKLSTLKDEIFPIKNHFEQFMHYIENIDLIKLYCLIYSVISQNKIVNFVQSSIANSFSFSNDDLKVGINNENFEIKDVEFTKFSKISRYLMDYSYKIIINVKKLDVNFIFQNQIIKNNYGSECDLELNDLSLTIILQNDTNNYLLQWIRFRLHLTRSLKEIKDFIPAVKFIDSYLTFLNNTLLIITLDKFEMIHNKNLDSIVNENSYKFKIIQLKVFQKDFENKTEKTLIDTIDHEPANSKVMKDLNNVLTCHITISSLNKAYIMSIDHAQFLFTNNSIFEFESLLFQSGLDINRNFIFNNCAIFMNTTEKEGYIIGTENIKFNIPAEIQDQSQIISDEKEIKRFYHDIKLYHRNNNQTLSKISNNFTIIFEKNNDSKSSTFIIPQLNIMELMTNSYFEATKKFDSIAYYSKYFLGNFFFNIF